jgi:hypothetical protein
MASRTKTLDRDILERELPNRNVLAFGAFIALALGLMTVRLLQDPQPVGDADSTWRQFATVVLAGGTPYADVWDNKPPLWHVITVLAAATGSFIPVLWGVITTANGTTAYIMYRLGRRHDLGLGAAFAGVIFLSILHVGHGWLINPRLVALPLILAALLVRRPLAVGALLAAACLLIQYAGFAIPIAVFYHYQRGFAMHPRDWLVRFAGAGVAIAAVAYGFVLAVWGVGAFEALIAETLLEAQDYASRLSDRGQSGFTNPREMIAYLSGFLNGVQPWLVLAALEVVAVAGVSDETDADLLSVTSALLAGAFALQFLWTFRANRSLSLLMPFLALLAAAGTIRLVRSVSTAGADQATSKTEPGD